MRKHVVAALSCAFISTLCGVFLGAAKSLRVPFLLSLVLSFGVAFLLSWLLLKTSFPVPEPRKEASAPSTAPASPSVPAQSPAPVSTGKKGYELFQRVVRYMEEKRPYLDEGLDLETFSKALFSNKVYVSKNINYYSGKNFRQFVNWYRIQYALELMRSDPHLKFEEVSVLSGFHSTVSFNMAFRLFVGKTPTEWHEEYVDSLRKR